MARKLICGSGEERFAGSGVEAVSVVNSNSFCGGTIMFEDEGTIAP